MLCPCWHRADANLAYRVCPKDGARLIDALPAEPFAKPTHELGVVLEERGARVTAVGSARAALAELGRAALDVLVSDLGVPDEDGLSLLRRVRALPREQGGHIPAVALTAHAGAEDQGRALRAGFSSHLAKPVEPSELVLVVKALVTNGGGRCTRPTGTPSKS